MASRARSLKCCGFFISVNEFPLQPRQTLDVQVISLRGGDAQSVVAGYRLIYHGIEDELNIHHPKDKGRVENPYQDTQGFETRFLQG